ncbi:MAG: outer membrane lipoprotein carrier protein LolA [Treponema sp.]|jgi:outer membrane lipoprotein-sorting protein|nr:outer membrane lipoprotein carrier protein LolA [Treponema sp.]
MKKIQKLMNLFFLVCAPSLFAQGITTASAYFKTISEYYATIKDYEVDFDLKIDKQESAGKISYKTPDLIRLDYTNPEEQVIVFNGDTLTVYLPESNAVLQQIVQQDNNTASLATPQGLTLMTRYYTVAYETGQNAEPLEADSSEMVVKLIFYRKNASEAFRSIKVSINPNTRLIRRIEAVSTKNEKIVFNFFDYKLNLNISDQRFIYDAPSSANNYNNFLFSE